MNKTLKRKWIKALRSGKFRQGNGDLYHNRTHCCLGVLARVQGATLKGGCLILKGEDVRSGEINDKNELLSSKYAAGLRENTQMHLADMNDGSNKYLGLRKNFAQIADYIEKKL